MSPSLSPTNSGRPTRARKSRLPIRRLAGFASAVLAALLLGSTAASAATKATPEIYTNASTNTLVGLRVFDHTNLMGGASPTGTISFKLFAPDDTTCQTPVFNATVPVSGTGSDNSPAYTTTAAGSYRWIATYNGDAANNPVDTQCGDASQTVIASKLSPVVSLTPTLNGTAIHATAILKGGFATLAGTLTFIVTGPNDQFCSGPTLYTRTVPVNGAGSYDSDVFTPATPGTYTYRIRYSGDTNNYGVGPTGCLTQGDSITLTPSQLGSALI